MKNKGLKVSEYMNSVNHNTFTLQERMECAIEYNIMIQNGEYVDIIEMLNEEYSNSGDEEAINLINEIKR